MSTANPDRLRRVSGLIDKWLDYQAYIKELPGLAAGISVGDEAIYRNGFGFADVSTREPVTPGTRFRIASHSKVFTATAIMQLVAGGLLRLDDRVADHLPWFRSATDANLEHITVRQLLTHSSGLLRDGDTGHWRTDRFPDLNEIVRQIAAGPSVYATNEHLKYSNFAYTVAGQIIETLTGMPYEEHISGAILDPLGLDATTPDLPEDMTGHATGYGKRFPDRSREAFAHVQARVMNAATGFSSTVDDLLRWYQAHLYGNDLLLDDWSKREMQRLQFEGRTFRWGIGFEQRKVGDLTFAGHGGGYPGFITYSGMNQEHQLCVVVLTNAIDGPASILFDGVVKLLAKALENDFDGTVGAEFDPFAGFYADRWRVQLLDRVGGTVVGLNADSADPTETLEIHEPAGDLRFRAPITMATGSPGEEFWFEDIAGTQRLSYPGGYTERFEIRR
jgi:CubicO group peptidase (beta-lactamase class C family)